jgi:hypothetical protein
METSFVPLVVELPASPEYALTINLKVASRALAFSRNYKHRESRTNTVQLLPGHVCDNLGMLLG